MFSFRLPNGMPFLSRKVLVCTLLFAMTAGSLQAKKASAGLAWQVQGAWKIGGKGTPVRTGDAIAPASLLQPGDTAGDHSITILLPDGQRVLYECFTVADCARGFRVPSLIHTPDAFATKMLARIGAALSSKRAAAPNGQRAGHATQTSRQQAVEVLDAANRVRIAGLIGGLPKGSYICDLRPLDPGYPPQFHLAIEKTAPSIELALPAAGLYNITITDALNAPRVDLLLAAIQPAQAVHFQSFSRARETMEKWNDDYAGWPIDDFLRAYLESLMRSAKASHAGKVP
jgi:hypothetical protein